MREGMTYPNHVERIKCPNCGRVQYATVHESIPFNIYVHECTGCGYIIMESEWVQVCSCGKSIMNSNEVHSITCEIGDMER